MEAHDMKYMLLICRDEPSWDKLSPAERQKIYADTRELSEELTSRGQYLGGFPLHPSSSATSVRVRDGKRVVTDGPFAETREQLGGYEVLGALGLVIPGLFRIRRGLTPLAAAGLVIIMIGATVITLIGGALMAAVISLVVGLLAAFVAYGRWRLAPLHGASRPSRLRPAS